MFEITKERADKKLEKIGLKLKFKIKKTDDESYSARNFKTVFINPEDRKCKWLAMQTEEHVLLHEVGHIVDGKYIKKFRFKSDPNFVELFGNVKRYYRRDLTHKFKDPYFISTYAQVHPSEDFAEIFAVYVGFEGNMTKIKKYLQKKHKNRQVQKQFIWLHEFMQSILPKK